MGFIPGQPEIAVEQPVGSEVQDGESLDFGAAVVGASSTMDFTIRNLGTANLAGLAVAMIGTNAPDFEVGGLGLTALPTGGSAGFTVTFVPGATGVRSAILRITSNDVDENPFDIFLTGTGRFAPYPQWAHDAGLAGDGALPASVPHGDGVCNLLKFAFKMNGKGPDARSMTPGVGTSGLPVLSSPMPGRWRFEFLRRKDQALAYQAQQSSSLAENSWQPVSGVHHTSQIDAEWERVWIDLPPDTSPKKLNFRVRVELNGSE